MEKQYRTVVQGEASESDDEEEVLNEIVEREEPKAFVVEGEASESEEVELDTSGKYSRRELPPLKLRDHSTSSDSINEITGVPTLSSRQAGRPKYDSVLNKKLWESNLSLCNNLNGLVSQAYLSSAKEINNCAHQLSKSHTAIQDVSHHMRLLTNDSFSLHDTVNIIATCTLLPNILLPKKTEPNMATVSAPESSVTVAI